MIPRLTLLDPSAREEIHARTLDVLWNPGVRCDSHTALDLLREAGAAVDDETRIARLPAELVERALALAPHEVLLAAREPGRDVLLDGSRTWLTLDGTGSNTLDFETGERRVSTAADVSQAARVADALDEIGVVWAPVGPNDAPANVEVLDLLACLLGNTGKHVQPEVQRIEEVPYVMEMLAAASPGGSWDSRRPICSLVYCPVSPLQHEGEMLEACLELARLGVPMNIYSLAMCGATAPVTLAGGVVQTNAEVLSAVVLFQLVRPGAGVIYTADCGVLDMRAGTFGSCGPEAVLMGVALTEMAQSYGLPVMATGFTSDAKEYSALAGLEGGVTALASMLARPDILCGGALIDSSQTMFLPKLVLDAEFFAQMRAIQEGFAADEAHLATDLIAEVGPGGNFLSSRHTREFLRAGEHYQPRAYQRMGYDAWKELGRGDVEHATDTVRAILAEHEVAPLPAGCEETFAAVVGRAAAELGGRA